VNGARFIESDVDTAYNGILHVIDHVFLEETLTSNAYSYITQRAERGTSEAESTR